MNFALDNVTLFITAIILAFCTVPVYFAAQWLRGKWKAYQENKKQDED